jgi:hypothetical protein
VITGKAILTTVAPSFTFSFRTQHCGSNNKTSSMRTCGQQSFLDTVTIWKCSSVLCGGYREGARQIFALESPKGMPALGFLTWG